MAFARPAHRPETAMYSFAIVLGTNNLCLDAFAAGLARRRAVSLRPTRGENHDQADSASDPHGRFRHQSEDDGVVNLRDGETRIDDLAELRGRQGRSDVEHIPGVEVRDVQRRTGGTEPWLARSPIPPSKNSRLRHTGSKAMPFPRGKRATTRMITFARFTDGHNG